MASQGGLPAKDDILTENSALRAQNIQLQREVASLKEQLSALNLELEGRLTVAVQPVDAALDEQANPPAEPSSSGQPPPRNPPSHGLSRAQVERYSRHLLLPSFGVAAQERLCRGSVLVVGCGGLGSPVAMYLAAAGVGRLGLVDHDAVDVTNLHRQVLHTTGRVGMHKALSGRLTCGAINPTIQVEALADGFFPATALDLVDRYDVVVDASDNPATRYLVSDACVVAGKPLVSAAAVGTDGQLTVYNYGEDGPCYRCLFPESPSPENCSRCGEAGVLGVVPGVMGCLQALEAIKILSGVGDVSTKKMTIFDALAGRFTTVRLRGRNPSCVACGSAPAITRASLPSYDYVLFTGQPPDDGPPEDLRLIDPRVRLSPEQVARLLVRQAADDVPTAATAAPAGAGAVAGVEMDAGAASVGRSAGSEFATASQPHSRGSGGVRLGAQDGGEVGTLAATHEWTAESAQVTSSYHYGGGGGGGGGGDAGESRPARAGVSGTRVGTNGVKTLFLDVRPKAQYDIIALPGVVHLPYERLDERLQELLAMIDTRGTAAAESTAAAGSSAAVAVTANVAAAVANGQPLGADTNARATRTGAGFAGGSGGQSDGCDLAAADPWVTPPRVVVLCRRGNNSQRVVAQLAALGVEGVTDMRGGYAAWAREVDPNMPLL